jgi:hypothetical protein
MDMLALRALEGPQIATSRTRFGSGEHHAALAFGQRGRWLGIDDGSD